MTLKSELSHLKLQPIALNFVSRILLAICKIRVFWFYFHCSREILNKKWLHGSTLRISGPKEGSVTVKEYFPRYLLSCTPLGSTIQKRVSEILIIQTLVLRCAYAYKLVLKRLFFSQGAFSGTKVSAAKNEISLMRTICWFGFLCLPAKQYISCFVLHFIKRRPLKI